MPEESSKMRQGRGRPDLEHEQYIVIKDVEDPHLPKKGAFGRAFHWIPYLEETVRIGSFGVISKDTRLLGSIRWLV